MPKSGLHLHKSILFTEKRPRKPETGEEINVTRISVWNIPSETTGILFKISRCSGKFSAGASQKVVFHVLFNPIFRKPFVNCKQSGFVSRI